MSHNQLQQKCWMHLWNTYPESRYCMWHTKNEDMPYKGEAKRDYVIRRSQDKALGLLPGVWDLVFYWKGVLHIFDIKIGKDSFSDKQLRFEDQIVKNGGQSYEIKDLITFETIVKTIMNG